MRLLTISFLFFLTFSIYAQNKTENVFLITLDGLRWQEVYTGADSSLIGDLAYVKKDVLEELREEFWADEAEIRREKLLPFFWSTIKEKGQLYGNRNLGNLMNVTNNHWFSYPGYSEILCGKADDERIYSNDSFANPNTNILEYLNKVPNYNGKVSAFGSWEVFPYILNEKRSNILVNAGFEKAKGDLSDKEEFLNELQDITSSPWHSVRLDAFTHQYALEHIKKEKPRVVYIAYGETDDFAHEGKYDSYLKSAHLTDAFIKELWDYAQSDPQYKDKTTIIITTDHGRGTTPKDTWQHHGNKLGYLGKIFTIKGSDQIWCAILGPDTKPMGEVKIKGQFYQNQIAATVAAALNQKFDLKDVGAPISVAFE